MVEHPVGGLVILVRDHVRAHRGCERDGVPSVARGSPRSCPGACASRRSAASPAATHRRTRGQLQHLGPRAPTQIGGYGPRRTHRDRARLPDSRNHSPSKSTWPSASQSKPDHLEGLRELGHLVIEAHPVRDRVLTLTRADPKEDPALAHVVQREELVREDGRDAAGSDRSRTARGGPDRCEAAAIAMHAIASRNTWGLLLGLSAASGDTSGVHKDSGSHPMR